MISALPSTLMVLFVKADAIKAELEARAADYSNFFMKIVGKRQAKTNLLSRNVV